MLNKLREFIGFLWQDLTPNERKTMLAGYVFAIVLFVWYLVLYFTTV